MTKELSQNKESHQIQEMSPRRLKAGKFIGRLGVAALCIIPPADLALSDAVTAKVYDTITSKIDTPSKTLERGLEGAAVGGFIMAESLALGQILTRSKKLDGAFDDFEEYKEKRYKEMGPVRKAISKTANAPLTAIAKIGDFVEKAGDKISARKSKIARAAGHLLIDTGRVNAVGTSTIVMEETMAGKAPSLGRQTYFSGLIAGSWVGAAELIRAAYRGIPAVRPPLAAIGRSFELLTDVNLSNPMRSPVATLAVSSVAMGLAYTGWKIEEFRQQHQELTAINGAEATIEQA